MSQYRVRPRAERDLIQHFAYIARDKVAPAERFLKAAERCFGRLTVMPQIGRPCIPT
jgi:plasmid stabilization system protein ParE